LNQSINDMTKMLRRILGEDIQIQFKFAPQSLPIHADAGMINQVLINLAVNSRDAMPKGGLLVIETYDMEFDALAIAQSTRARPGSFVCLSVSDNGCGIPPEILPKIFEPFFHHQRRWQRHWSLGLPPSLASSSSIKAGLTSIANSAMEQPSAFTFRNWPKCPSKNRKDPN